MTYTCLDLFCGAGGLSLGLANAGINILLGIDNDKAAIETYCHNHVNNGTVSDLTSIDCDLIKEKTNNQKIDIIAGGPPCQGLSLSGPRKIDDSRNQLYRSFVRIVADFLPKAILLENVPGLMSLYKGKIKDAILNDFSKLGYKMSCSLLRASDFGVPQHRKRIFFIGLRNGKQFKYPKETHFNGEDLFKRKKMISCGEALSDLPFLPDLNYLGEPIQKYGLKPQNEYQTLMRKNSSNIYNHIAAKHSDKVRNTIKLVPAGMNYKTLPKDLQGTRNFNVAWTRFPIDSPAPTIDTGHRHHFHHTANRVPTVRECARLQSFPDTFIFHGNKTEQFRQVGNAVPPLLAEAIGKALKKQIMED